MIKEKMTVTEALTQLKILNERISQRISEGKYVGTACEKTLPPGFKSKEELEIYIKGSHDSVKALIERRMAIKRAIVKSNALTNVTISDKVYSVAEAIEFKNSIGYEKDFLANMASQFHSAQLSVQKSAVDYESKCSAYIVQRAGSEKAATKDDFEIAEKNYSAYKLYMVDPIGIENKIAEKQKYIDSFLTQVDTQLAIANAKTVIEYEY